VDKFLKKTPADPEMGRGLIQGFGSARVAKPENGMRPPVMMRSPMVGIQRS
jgi:hypothetical protein